VIVRPSQECATRQELGISRRCFAGVGTAEDLLPGRPRHSKKNHEELLRDCECVQEWRQTRLNELQEF
jgi:hypothetical protein